MASGSAIYIPRQVLPSNNLGNAVAETQFQAPPTAGTPAATAELLRCNLPSGSHLIGKSFKVKASGRVTGGTTTNFTISLYYGVSTTIASNTLIEQSTARAVNSESGNWTIEALLTWDSTSNKIQGKGWSMVNNLVDAEAVIDNEVTSADPTVGTTELGFNLTGLFSATNANNAAFVTDFSVEVL